MNPIRNSVACISERLPFTLLISAGLLLGLLISGVVQAKPVLEVIQLQHRQGLELAEVIRPTLGKGTTVSPMGSKLIVQAEAADMAQIKTLIAKLDKAAHNFQLIVKFTTTEKTEKKDDGAALKTTGGKVTGAGVRAKRVLTTTVNETVQRAKVMENSWARFKLLKGKPVTMVTTVKGKNGQPLQQTQVVTQEEETGFRIQPRVSGGKILLTIASAQQAMASDNGVQTVAAETSVLIPGNKWIRIGGNNESGRQTDKELRIPAIGFLETESMKDTVIEIKAELLD